MASRRIATSASSGHGAMKVLAHLYDASERAQNMQCIYAKYAKKNSPNMQQNMQNMRWAVAVGEQRAAARGCAHSCAELQTKNKEQSRR